MTRPATFELTEKKKNMIEIIAIWDRSGSMQSLVSDAIRGFYSFLENAYTKFSSKQIQEMIRHQREVYSWEFLSLAANQDAIATGERIGVHQSAAVNVQAAPAGYRAVGHSMSFASAAVSEGACVASINMQRHYDANLKKEEDEA